MNFFKKKPITVTFMTSSPAAYAFGPVFRGAKALPQWWRDLPTESEYNLEAGEKTINMRGCMGLIDFYKKAVVLPMWSDVAIKIGSTQTPGFSYQFADFTSEIDSHHENQFQGLANNNDHQHIKLVNPWTAVSSEPLDWLMQGIPYSMKDPTEYTALPGVLNFYYTHSLNVQMLFKRDAYMDRHIHISHGTPLAALHPLSERELELKILLMSPQELQVARAREFPVTFLRKGMYNRKLIKSGAAQVTCPFGGKSL